MKSTKRVFVVVLALALTVALAAIPASALTMATTYDHGTIPGPGDAPGIDWTIYLYVTADNATATADASRNTIVVAHVEADLHVGNEVFHNTDEEIVSGMSAKASVNNIPQEDPSKGPGTIWEAVGSYGIDGFTPRDLRLRP